MKMKNIYNAPDAVVLKLGSADVIAASPLTYSESGDGDFVDFRKM